MFRIDEPAPIAALRGSDRNAFRERGRGTARGKCFGSAKIPIGANLVFAFIVPRSRQLDNHVEIGDGTVQLALTAECHCLAAKCRKIIRLQSDDAIKISNCSVETRPWPSRDPAIVDRNVIVGH
jgi:hypothetical protein